MNRSQSDSAYYPRRAGPFSWLWYRWFRLKKVNLWSRVINTSHLDDGEQLLSLLLPGYVFVALGYHKIGISLVIAFPLAALVSLAAIGLPLATYCFCFMLSLQSISILQLIHVRAQGMITLPKRLGLACLLVIGLSALVYAPLNQFVRAYIVVPLHTPRGTVLVNPRWDASEVQTGDTIAYQIEAASGDGYRIHGGVLYGRILASEGDEIVFFSHHYELNGTDHVPRRRMPSEGGLTIEPGFWFIWPYLNGRIIRGNNLGIGPDLLRRTAIVSKEQFVGKLYRNWFGRNQSRLHHDTRSSL